ncbi:MAG: DUF547 domain-containing protein [Cyclobacteriaceae bacterium]
MNSLLALCFLITSSVFVSAQQLEEGNLFEEINKFLLIEVSAGKLDYQSLKENRDHLDKITQLIAFEDLSNKDKNYKKAFYLNAYNLTVIKQITDNYPISSPFDVDGFFKVNKFNIAGEMLTLDEIEFDKIMAPYRDSRVHFALGCGAMSCPFLYDNAFKPDLVEEQLKFRSQTIIDRPDYVKVDEANKTITLNKIFDWYGDQFSYNAGSLINFINKYRFYKVPIDYEVLFAEYDWSLNDLKGN